MNSSSRNVQYLTYGPACTRKDKVNNIGHYLQADKGFPTSNKNLSVLFENKSNDGYLLSEPSKQSVPTTA